MSLNMETATVANLELTSNSRGPMGGKRGNPIPDEQASNCMECNALFNLVKRKVNNQLINQKTRL